MGVIVARYTGDIYWATMGRVQIAKEQHTVAKQQQQQQNQAEAQKRRRRRQWRGVTSSCRFIISDDVKRGSKQQGVNSLPLNPHVSPASSGCSTTHEKYR